MSSRITCEVRTTAPVAVVRLAGTLHLGTMRSVHHALTEALVDQPEALVVDMAEVNVEDRLALSVFAATARRAEEWPAVPVLLCAPSPIAARWLAESTTCRVLPVSADCAEATRLARTTSALRMRARLEPVAGPAGGPGSWSPTRARGGTCPTRPARPRWCSASWSATWCATPARRCR
ncbi:STAS domain-containing protein [Micromonospora sp. CA-269861]|uniref:STAS domain-containing protein n=1 Tax=Micromonospora sp. CA-269861 TaxID=3239968 RepID=UPI003D9083B3